MIGLYPRKGKRMKGCVAAAAVAILALAGCGADGSSGIHEPDQHPNTEAALIGTVRMPNGQFAAVNPFFRFMDDLHIVRKAFAIGNGAGLPSGFLPVGAENPVSLYRVAEVDVDHGNTA